MLGFVTLCGAAFVGLGIDKLGKVVNAEHLFKLGLGIFILLVACRIFRYYYRPVFSLTDDSLHYFLFLGGNKKVEYRDLLAAADFVEQLEPRPGTSVKPPAIHRLVLVTKNGGRISLILPVFGAAAAALIEAFATRSKADLTTVHSSSELEEWFRWVRERTG